MADAPSSLGAHFRSGLPFLAVLVAQLTFGGAVIESLAEGDRYFAIPPLETIGFLSICLPMAMAFVCVYRMVWYTRPASPISALIAGMRAYRFDRQRLRNGSIVIALLVPFLMMFSVVKTSIPAIVPFSWDETLTAWDRALFFGYLPYEWLQPIVGHDVVTVFLDITYKLWFILMWMSLVAFAFARTTSALRTRYLLSFFVTWFLQGSVLALVFSSAGPCFYGLLDIGPDPYQPLMAYLREASLSVPVSALDMQTHLWSGYKGDVVPLGISAAPSLHNATSLLMALAAWKVDRRLGLILSAFAVVIFVGSISLAWHYAVDGLIAFPVTLLTWIAAGRFADGWENVQPRTR